MTTEQVGAYLLLLCKAWLNDPPCSIPDDDEILSRWTRLGDRWSSVKARVLVCFTLRTDGNWYQERLEVEYRKFRSYQRQAAENGKRGAKKRWGGYSDPNSPPNGVAIATPLGSDGSSSSFAPSPTALEPKTVPRGKPPPAGGVDSFLVGDALAMVHDPILAGIGDLWSDWMRMRFNAPKHKRPTRLAAELALKALGKWTPEQRRTALENTIKNGWLGIFEPKENANGHRHNGTAHRDNKRANEYPENLTVPIARIPVNGNQGRDTTTPL